MNENQRENELRNMVRYQGSRDCVKIAIGEPKFQLKFTNLTDIYPLPGVPFGTDRNAKGSACLKSIAGFFLVATI